MFTVKPKKAENSRQKSLQILPASADLHIFEVLKVHSWELSDPQTTSLWPSVQRERPCKYGIAFPASDLLFGKQQITGH